MRYNESRHLAGCFFFNIIKNTHAVQLQFRAYDIHFAFLIARRIYPMLALKTCEYFAYHCI